MKILFVSGGSVGHLAPLVAVEREVKVLKPKTETLFLCSTKKEDGGYLTHEKVPFVRAMMPKRKMTLPFTYILSALAARKVLRQFKPDVIFSKGGALSVPLCKAARRKKIPIVLHESDSVMGKANKIVAKFATAICLGFPPSDEQRMFRVKPTVTGNPIRPNIMKGSRAKGLKIANLSGKKPVLLVLGGSQGAQALNEAIQKHIPELLHVCDIVHITGKGKTGAGRRAGYFSTAFAYKELADLYAIGSLALSRAGAGMISELSANAIPMILVPIRGLANDHQFENAVRAEREGAAILLEQDHLDRDLADCVKHLLERKEKMASMKKNCAALAQPEAARHIAKILLESVAKKKKSH